VGKKVILVVAGAIIGTHYYIKGGRPLEYPTQRLQPRAYDARELRRPTVRLAPAPLLLLLLRA
jgi:hypothetical protein